MQVQSQASFTTFSVFRYAEGSRWWALKQMGLMPIQLNKIKGLKFFKLMGSGKGLAFSLLPDWGRYMLMAVWENREVAEDFFQSSVIIKEVKAHSLENWTVKLEPVHGCGMWSGVNPFDGISKNSLIQNEPIAVLTRATVKWLSLARFWKHAVASSEALTNAKGLLFSCGVGEKPFTRQATFSIWENLNVMKAFAYGAADHKTAIRERQKQQWYSEELFARFRIVGSEGTYLGKDPLEGYLKQSNISALAG